MEYFQNIDFVGKQVKFLDGRYYTKDNENWYPGITSILGIIDKGHQFKVWLQSNGFNSDVLARYAMDRGSNVHAAIQSYLEGNKITFGDPETGRCNYTKDEWELISRFVDFYTGFNPKIVAIEKVIVSDKLQFGTQLDLVCEIPGYEGLFYVDHKTGSMYDSAKMQLAAGSMLWNEYFPEMPIKHTAIMHLEAQTRGRDKKGEKIQGDGWKLEYVGNIEENWEDFKHAQAIWKRQNPNYKPLHLILPLEYLIENK